MASELETLRQENASLKQRLHELITPKPEHVGRFLIPTPDQMAALHKRVTQSYRCLLAPDRGDDRAEELQAFGSAFRYITTLSRTAEGEWSKDAHVTWCDRATSWLQARSMPTNLTVRSLVAAIIAQGDVHFTIDPSNFPFSLNYSLRLGGDRLGDGAAWQRLLDGGSLRPATKLEQPSWSCGVANTR